MFFSACADSFKLPRDARANATGRPGDASLYRVVKRVSKTFDASAVQRCSSSAQVQEYKDSEKAPRRKRSRSQARANGQTSAF